MALALGSPSQGRNAPTDAAAKAATAPLWEVRDADSTLYLFGTVHVLRPETQWRSPAIDQALATSAEVWFEVDPELLNDPAQQGRMMAEMLSRDGQLSARIPPALYERFRAGATKLGIPPERLEQLRTGSAAILLASVALIKAGFTPDSGVDKALRAAVPNPKVRQLETVEKQMSFITGLPEDVQAALLSSTLEDLDDLGKLDRIVTAWARGDISGLSGLFLKDMQTQHPHAYDVFVKDRNQAWADRLDAELKGTGTDFVAAGALHMVGPDGLPTLLEKRGYTVRRVQ